MGDIAQSLQTQKVLDPVAPLPLPPSQKHGGGFAFRFLNSLESQTPGWWKFLKNHASQAPREDFVN